MRNFLATLFFSQGVPMLVAGDELGRSQGGNNNAYCQDNEISWVHWLLDGDAQALQSFTQRALALRNKHPLFRRRTFFRGRAVHDSASKDIVWLNPDGREMTDEEWTAGFARCLGAQLSGHGLTERDERGKPVEDDDLLLLVNAHDDAIPFKLPSGGKTGQWLVRLDTDTSDGTVPREAFEPDTEYPLQGRSLVLLCRPRNT
jgi:glycogen operon protein